ncbi:PREDICTED: xaa-Pro dipeptidase [Nicrophorus vespilloides]|uniref:Xaa-Pro dipeptidase n=1 Tax=Nicrophorus vespilloides TaxID=110193 RepID=A0ABM1NAK6_NICVS|nr:PREDICTED: xaa-Pro dipeptidase [Nicrophorus vespilloides]XP_017783852.1 PREDICTED: xaa-Pro dipeptidase [Nicrophorus vespilloides]XP_017783853.1 PREDICTED: xaa-Pro dipeptidase [Nicrophorus vespilloides]XP_017783855.1 PREDICTED: xaa-Pro dipeptidase [Nicrophorus vespilloides]XP_017783856.1 PREDICTED: xaa-Pro dipeptidase [Nicrophorus vespilloides]
MLSMGQGTCEVPLELYALNRRRLCDRLKEKNVGDAIVLLQGGEEVPFYDTDVTYNVFRQESYFMWTFGVLDAGCFGAVVIKTGKSLLFVPRLPDSYAVWMGPLLTLDDFKNKYKVDSVYYVDQLADVLKEQNPSSLLTLKGVNTDSGLTAKDAEFDGIDKFTVDKTTLFNEIADLRVIKTDMELEVLKYVTEVSSAAHRVVMRKAKAGMSEYQCESVFLDHCYRVGGCRFVSYTCICGAGANGAVLHYGHAGVPNDKPIKNGDICLFDMGANYYGYAADITCSFPENGKFTADQKMVYEAVLAANLAVFNACKPGVCWVDMHQLSLRTMLEYLKKGGLLVGDVDDMMKAGLGPIFQPHGLGHLIGLDVHDVGGYLPSEPSRPSERGVNKLRMARTLKKGMCLTIEPGCYFIKPLLDEALNDPKLSTFIVKDVLERFRGTGGVRIEDDVYITETGCVNMTKVPRTVQEIEDWMSGKDSDSKYN